MTQADTLPIPCRITDIHPITGTLITGLITDTRIADIFTTRRAFSIIA